MLTPSDIQTITSELQIMMSHKDAFEKSLQNVMNILNNKGVQMQITELGARAVAEREARMMKKVV
jgi:hypothetical protein